MMHSSLCCALSSLDTADSMQVCGGSVIQNSSLPTEEPDMPGSVARCIELLLTLLAPKLGELDVKRMGMLM